MKDLLTTKGKWYDLIALGIKKFDFRKGYIDVNKGDIIKFIESDELGNPTGIECFGKVNLVIHSGDFPEHFGWVGPEFTIFQFGIEEKTDDHECDQKRLVSMGLGYYECPDCSMVFEKKKLKEKEQ